jgi:[acyl-carrier-protein] S-malonyltransferase
MTSYALLFPGQGAQYVGMGKSFLAKRSALFEEAEDILSIPLQKLMFEGPQDELTATSIAQPAILLHSIAAFDCLQQEFDVSITCALGHSLGEYSALVAAKVISFADAIKAVHQRGLFMQEAVPQGEGAMAAVLGMDPELIVEALMEFGDEHAKDYATCANFNGPLQTVIAGTKLGVNKASEKLKALGAKRIVELPVSAPFHCALMKPVQKKMVDVLKILDFKTAQFPLISNVSAQAEVDGSKIRELLLTQIAHPVKFTTCVHHIKQAGLGGDGFLELGPKNTLSSIVKKIDASSKTLSVDSSDDMAQFAL